MKRHSRNATRRGSALLVCTLAAAVLSMAAITIIRSTQRSIARVDAAQSSSTRDHVADGLFQRSIAVLRDDPNAQGIVADPGNGMADAFSELTQLSATETRIRVFLYAGSSIPAIDTIVDPNVLAGGGGGGGGGGGNGNGNGNGNGGTGNGKGKGNKK